MPKILANIQTGEQILFDLDIGGRINEPVDIVWYEVADGQMQDDIVVGKMQRQGASMIELPDYIPAHVNTVLPRKKAEKIVSLTESYDSAIYANIDHAEKTWTADKKSQEILSQVLAVGSVPVGMYWRDITGTSNPMTYADLQSLASAILARGLAADTKLAEKITAVNAATTLTEVDSLTW